MLGSVLLEGVAVGLIASIVGLARRPRGEGLTSLLSALGIDLPSGSLVVLPRTVIEPDRGRRHHCCLALFPASGLAIPPVAAMREVAVDTSASSRKRVIIGLVALVLGVLLLFAGLAKGGGKGAIQVGLSALVVFAAATILGPVIAKPVSKVLGAPLPRLRGMSGTLAKQNAVRNPRRTASTAAALMIGVGIVVFILVLAASVKQSFSNITGSQLKADYIVNTTGGFANSMGFSPDVATQISARPKRRASRACGSARCRSKAARRPCSRSTRRRSRTCTTSRTSRVRSKTRQDQHDRGRQEGRRAERMGDRHDDQRHLRERDHADGDRRLIDGSKAFANWAMGIPTYELHFADQFDSFVFVKLKPGATGRPSSRRERDPEGLPHRGAADARAVHELGRRPDQPARQRHLRAAVLVIIIALLGIATPAVDLRTPTRDRLCAPSA